MGVVDDRLRRARWYHSLDEKQRRRFQQFEELPSLKTTNVETIQQHCEKLGAIIDELIEEISRNRYRNARFRLFRKRQMALERIAKRCSIQIGLALFLSFFCELVCIQKSYNFSFFLLMVKKQHANGKRRRNCRVQARLGRWRLRRWV